MDNKENPKQHADFQDNYRRSSNFNNSLKDEDFKIKKNGKLKMEKDSDKKEADFNESEKKRIKDAVDSYEERTDSKPDGEQSDNK